MCSKDPLGFKSRSFKAAYSFRFFLPWQLADHILRGLVLESRIIVGNFFDLWLVDEIGRSLSLSLMLKKLTIFPTFQDFNHGGFVDSRLT